jgi:hypothetical protein
METARDWIANLFASCCGIRRRNGGRHEPEFLLHEPSVEEIQTRARYEIANPEPKQSKNELSVRDMDTIDTIKNSMGQLSDGLSGTTDQDYAAISEALNALPDELLRVIFINEILNEERRRYRRVSDSRTQDYVRGLINTLEEAARKEVEQILRDLPPAVLGDDSAQQESRVLIDLSNDVRSAMSDLRHDTKKRNLIETAVGIVHAALVKRSDALTLALFMVRSGLSSPEQIRAVLAQILLASVFVADSQHRNLQIDDYFKKG